jgi:oxygen-dependent protoporphyrinogen oxidase
VLEELRQTLGLAVRPTFSTVARWKKAIPLYTVDHLQRVAEAEAMLPDGVTITGNAYRGVGINDCVRNAEMAANKAADDSRPSRP